MVIAQASVGTRIKSLYQQRLALIPLDDATLRAATAAAPGSLLMPACTRVCVCVCVCVCVSQLDTADSLMSELQEPPQVFCRPEHGSQLC